MSWMTAPRLLWRLLLFFLAAFSLGALDKPAAGTEEGALLDETLVESREDQAILITAAAEAGEPPAVPGQVTLIGREQIEASGARNLGEAVKTVPGVNVIRQGSLTDPALVSIRGSGEDQVLVLLDGRSLNDLAGGAVDLSTVSLDNVESIRVIRGGSGAWYGNGAFGGVILISTRKGDSEGVAGGGNLTAEYGYGAFRTHRAAFQGALPLNARGNLRLALAADGYLTKGEWEYTAPGEDIRRLNSGGSAASVSGSLERDGVYRDNTLTLMGEARTSSRGSPGLMEFLTPLAGKEETRYGGSLTWESRDLFPGELLLEVLAQSRYSGYRNPGDGTDEEHENRRVMARGLVSPLWEGPFFILQSQAGLSWEYQILDSTGLTDSSGTSLYGRGRQQEGGLQARAALDFGRLDFTPAVRYDLFFQEYAGVESRFNHRFSWSGAVEYSPLGEKFSFPDTSGVSEPVVFTASVSSVYRNPSFEDLFWSSGGFAAGNPDLLPEEGINSSGGVRFTRNDTRRGDFTGELVWFQNRINNLIQWLPSAGGIWRPSNVGEALIQGLEASLNYLAPLSGGRFFLETRAGWTWMSSLDKGADSVNFGKQLAYRPLQQASLTLTGRDTRGNSLEAGAGYLGYRFTNNAGTKYLDPVLTLDASLKISPGDFWFLSLAVGNLTNRQYIHRLGYPVPGREWSVKGGIKL